MVNGILNECVKKKNIHRPNFLGIGAPKCGTTWLSEVLRSHPSVFMVHEKELVYFSSSKKYSKGEEWYLSHFSNVKAETAIGEFSVSYLGEGEIAANRIKSFSPDMKLIAMLRDPVYRAWSHYRWLLQLGKYKGNFKDALVNCPADIVRHGLYYRNLLCFFEIFPAENILILKYEDIKNDSKMLQRKLFYFLGVDEKFDSGLANKVIGETISPRSMVMESLRIKTHVFARKNNLAFLITLFKKSGLSRLYRQLNNQQSRNISKDEYLEAAKYFRTDVNQLEDLTKIDFSNWLVWNEPN